MQVWNKMFTQYHVVKYDKEILTIMIIKIDKTSANTNTAHVYLCNSLLKWVLYKMTVN